MINSSLTTISPQHLVVGAVFFGNATVNQSSACAWQSRLLFVLLLLLFTALFSFSEIRCILLYQLINVRTVKRGLDNASNHK